MKTIKHRITNVAAQNSIYSAPRALQLITIFAYWQQNNRHKTQHKELLLRKQFAKTTAQSPTLHRIMSLSIRELKTSF